MREASSTPRPAVRPPTAIERVTLEKAATDNGFGIEEGEAEAWHRFRGLGVPYTLWIARGEGVWFAGLAHGGVMAALSDLTAAPLARPDGGPAVAVTELEPLVRRMARLARSLPPAPLEVFQEKTRRLPRTTEAERQVVQRVGQDVFREALFDYWSGRCPLTGITHPRLLRASHIKPWAQCDSDAERLDVHNGLLLAAHLDAAFDAGLITFADDGALRISPALSATNRTALHLDAYGALRGLTEKHLSYLAVHRAEVFQN